MSDSAISDEAGVIFLSRAMDDALHEVLEDMFVNKRSLFPPTIKSIDDLQKQYKPSDPFGELPTPGHSISKSRHPTSTYSKLLGHGRESKGQAARRPGYSMQNYHADITLLIILLVRYTWAM
jgi:hypothetical protein